MKPDLSPTARALLALELVQGSPGITADRLAGKLGVSARAARRYVEILREPGLPIESARGPYGGYRLGRGLRLPPLMFTAAEALGLVMAVLDGHHDAVDPADPVGSALGKIMRVLPEPVAAQADAVGWEYDVEVVIDAPIDALADCLPRAIGRLEPVDAATTRLVGSTGNPAWYAEQLATVRAPYRIVKCPELRQAARALGQRLLAATEKSLTFERRVM